MIGQPHRNVTFKVIGSRIKTAQCENCGTSYFFALALQEEYSATARENEDSGAVEARAKAKATELLHKALANGVGAAPCPTCGKYQQAMIDWRRSHNSVIFVTLTVLLLFAAVVIAFMTLVMELYMAYSQWLGSPEFHDVEHPLWLWTLVLVCASPLPILVEMGKSWITNPARKNLPERLEIAQRTTIVAQNVDNDKLARLRHDAEAVIERQYMDRLRRSQLGQAAVCLIPVVIPTVMTAFDGEPYKGGLIGGILLALIGGACITGTGVFFWRYLKLRRTTFQDVAAACQAPAAVDERALAGKPWTQKILDHKAAAAGNYKHHG